MTSRCRACGERSAVLFDLETHRPAVLNEHPSRPYKSVMGLCAQCMGSWLLFGPQGEERAR